jgi:3-oxoacyl-[acyl-carrier-protein] synthase-3
MALLKANHMKIAGVCGALPEEKRSVFAIGAPAFDRRTVEKVTSAVGTRELYVARADQTAADLCFAAAERLLETLRWDRASVDGLIFISQSPDYQMPATSCVLQDRLRLPKDCVTVDVNLGCSAFVYGLFLAAHLIELRTCERVLLLVGDVLRRQLSPFDKNLTFVLSDAGSAAALVYSDEESPSVFLARSDGSGCEKLIRSAGAARTPSSETTRALREDADGNRRSAEHIYMDGKGVFTFVVKEIPEILTGCMEARGWDPGDVDAFLLHQANAYMLRYLAKRAKIPMEKIPINIEKYGNTNGSTIPFLLCDLADGLLKKERNIEMSGFGVGLSVAAAAMRLGALRCGEIVRV